MLGMSGIVIKEMKCLGARDISVIYEYIRDVSPTHTQFCCCSTSCGDCIAPNLSLYPSNPQPFGLGILVKIEREY